MIKPWEIKSSDIRVADNLPTFIIFCEDEVSEPTYFKFFETTKIKVNPIKKQDSKITNVIKTICYCQSNGLMQENDGLMFLETENIQIWCVFDRDIETNALEIQRENISFDESIVIANEKGFNVAWSNDAFELWILLHFEDVDLTNTEHKKRDFYYKRLTEIFKNLPDKNQNLINALKHGTFSYKKDLKSENNFRNIVRTEITGKTNDAITRAKIIEEHHTLLNLSNHDKSPCTLVHHLVEELIRLGGKTI